MKQALLLWLFSGMLLPLCSAYAGDIIFNEIMYHPASENGAEEYIELHNTGTNAVDLGGWQFTRGISLMLPTNTRLPAGGYLLVVADTNAFAVKYPGVTRVLGNWTGRLNNSDEEIELQDASGNVVDRVHYADEGDWANRISGAGEMRVLSLTRIGSTATVVVDGHYGTSDQMQIYGADQPEYNGTFTISGVVDGGGAANNRPSTSFNFTVPGAPDSPATGLIICRQLTDVGGRGWAWTTHADGLGRSLEVVNPNLPNEFGQNWRASISVNGTPGRANSVLNTNTAPLIGEVAHFPPIPKPIDPVTVTARIATENTNGLTATVRFRDHTTTSPAPIFSAATMLDDGLHNDGVAGDGLYGATLPAQPNGTIIEFYVEAIASGNQTNTWPTPAIQQDGSPGQTANTLYQVDDDLAPPSFSTANQPMYRLIMTATERNYYSTLSGNSDAQMNGTFISSDADGIKVRYNAGIRTRGAGSRGRTPRSLRVNLPTDRKWNGLAEINLKTQFIHAQLAAHALAARAGLPGEEARAVQLRVNGENWAPTGAPVNGGSQGAGWGTCLYVEPLNADWAERLLPNNAGGNVYRGSKYPWNANLDYLGTDYLIYVNAGYSKSSNQSENDWTDLFNLTWALTMIANDADYVEAVRTNVNVELFMRYFALCNLIGYNESSMCNGIGDDYAMYRGIADPRFMLVPHDFDTILAEGDNDRMTSTTGSIWRMVDTPRSTDPTQRANYLQRFMRHPEFAPVYLREMKRLCDTFCTPEQFNSMLDQLLGDWVEETNITSMKNYLAARRAYVLSVLPLNFSIELPLARQGGCYATAVSTVTLTGGANALETDSVHVNGAPAVYSAWNGRWTNTVNLLAGINRVRVRCFDSNQVEIASDTVDIWLDTGVVQDLAGTIATDTIWATGNYNVTNHLNVASGATLTIEPGTTVYLGPGVNFTVTNGGRLVAEGTASVPIRFVRPPGSASTWGSIAISGNPGSPETRIRYAHLEGNGSTAIHSSGGTVFLDHLTFGSTDHQYLSLDSSSFVVSDCNFPTPTASFEPAHGAGGIKAGGRGLFLRNFFGAPNGYNDVIDFTGGNRPGPIVQFINNVFTGSGDDILDLDSTDAWVEGNLFLHVHKNGSPDTSSAVSGGADTADTSEVTVIGNVFYDCDHAATAKQGGFFTLLNNTIVRQTRQGGTDTQGAVVCLQDNNMTEGAGMYLEGNIIYEAEQLVQNVTSALVMFTNNFMSLPWSGPGGGNSALSPLLSYVPQLSETTNFTSWQQAQVLRDWLSLRAGSPARSAGPNGRDAGGAIPLSVSISGEPDSPTPQTTTLLTVGVNRTGSGITTNGWPDGCGYTHYRWRLDGGAWSAETPITIPILLTGLANGPHYIEVVGRRDSGLYQDDPLLGPDAVVTRSRTWTVNTNLRGIRLNEVLASNRAAVEHEGTHPDLVELFNAGATEVDLGGMGLTDDLNRPFRFVFPMGTVLEAGDYLVLYADDNHATSGLHLGFALAQGGGGVYLYDGDGVLLDSVTYGAQLTDLSIGRLADMTWGLTHPTFGAANRRHPTGDPQFLRLNEWLAASQTFFRNDFVELLNLDFAPVDMGGCFLTDNPIGWPSRHAIAPLTFIEGDGYFTFIADGQTNQGVDHLSFKLRSEQGLLGLFDARLNLIDCVYYEAQQADLSQGRSPSGSGTIAFFAVPTPGGANPVIGGSVTISNINITLLPIISSWRYERSGADLGNTWTNVNYDDSAWPSGLALLGVETATMAYPLNTVFPNYNNAQPTYYFRTTFVVETNLAGFNTITMTTMLDDGAVIYLNGAELRRIRLADGPVYFNTIALLPAVGDAAPETFTINPALILPGTNFLAVEVHQSLNPTSTDVVWGMGLTATRTVTNVTQTTLVLNEVMANNQSVANSDGTVTDWVELYNPGDNTKDLSGLSLTDDSNNPQRWVFPAGASISARGYLVVRCDPNAPESTNAVDPLNTGFGLKASGERIYLYDRSTGGGAPPEVDSIAFGLQAADFSLGRVPDGYGAWTLCLSTLAARNIAATLGNASALKINEWMADPAGGDDWFELFNPGNQPVAIGNLYLTDDLTRRTKYRIPPHSYLSYGGSGFAVFAADNNPDAGADHTNFKLAREGESIGLFTASGVTIDAITFGFQQTGVSEGRLLDGSINIVRFPNSASPCSANYLPLTQVVVNEVLSHSDPPFQDAIELRNLSEQFVDLSGWWLSDDANDLQKFRVPDGTVLSPLGLVVFYEYQFNPPPFFYPAFALSGANGDDVQLSEADPSTGALRGYRATVSFGPSENAVSLGRYETSVGVDFVALSQRTFGLDNPATTNEFIQGAGLPNAYPKLGPVVISEIMYHPPDLGTNDNTIDECIELYNITDQPLPLFHSNAPAHTWHLRGGIDFNFPTNVIVPPHGYVLVVNFDPADTAARAVFCAKYSLNTSTPMFGPYQGKLANDGEGINLNKPDDPDPITGDTPYVLIEGVKYADSAPWPSAADGNTNHLRGVSLQRRIFSEYGNDPVNWIAGLPTPAAANGPAIAELPSITVQPTGQTVVSDSNVTLSVTAAGASPLKYQWRHDGAALAGATNETLTITNAQATDSGKYTVLICNPAGAVLSAPAIVTLLAPPEITRQPQSRSGVRGDTVSFSVWASGYALHYQWRLGGQPIAHASNSVLVLSNAQPSQAGPYDVIVWNPISAVTSTVATLTVFVPPEIVTQPQDTTAVLTYSASFSVIATGTPPLYFQWRFHGTTLAGATAATLDLHSVSTNHAGPYDVVVWNSVGLVTSGVARLTVIVPPTVTILASSPSDREPGFGTSQFMFARSGLPTNDLVVHYSVSGSAAPGTDYTSLPGIITIPIGAASANLPVQVLDDQIPEGPETVIVTLTNSLDYLIGGAGSASVLIYDDDNLLPAVAITRPTNETFFSVAPAGVLIHAEATDSDGSVATVQFFNGTNKLGDALAAPFELVWTNPPAGTNTITAVATDNLGAEGVSAVVRVIVNFPPTVSITSPTNNAAFRVSSNITITATAADVDGTVRNVSFFAGSNLLGSTSLGPVYSVLWTSAPLGLHSLTAVAADNWGVVSTSSVVRVSVQPASTDFADLFAERGAISGVTHYLTATNSNASSEPGEPAPFVGTGNRTLWVSWTAPGNGWCTIDTIGSMFDTVLSVFSNDPPWIQTITNLVLVGGDDDGGGGLVSLFTFRAQAGTLYHIRVAGWGDYDGGTLRFHLSFATQVLPPSVPNVLFASAASSSQISLYWNVSTNGPEGYLIERSTNGINFQQVASVSAATTSYLDTRLSAGVTCYYRVRSFNERGTSGYSAIRSATTTTPDLSPFTARINFATGTAPVPYQWETDDGAVFGDRGNGYTYGWDADNSLDGRLTGPGTSPYDSFQFMGKPGGGSVWELDVPTNASYVVHIVAGSASELDGFYRIAVEGVRAIDGQPTALHPFLQSTNVVLVTDGRLSLSNIAGSIENRLAFVEVSSARPPIILAQPVSRTVGIGAFAMFTVLAEGTGPLRYQWRKDGADIDAATNAAYTITNVQIEHAGLYSVVVSSPYGTTSSSNASLSAVTLPEDFFDDFDPGIHSEQWLIMSDTVAATNIGGCVSGANALWFGGDGERFATTRSLNASAGGMLDFQLRLANGLYPWEIPDLPGEGIALEFSTDQESSWTLIRAYDTYTFTNWTRVQETIPTEARRPATVFRWRQMLHSGACCDHWALDDVTVTVSTGTPPTVRSQPSDRVAALGGSTTFNVVVSGSTPLFYQWLFNDSTLIGETNASLTLSNLTAYSQGVYSVIVSNAWGGALSSNALLTVDLGTTSGTLTVFDFPKEWKYNQTANLTGTGWFGTNYNDSAWPSGAGLLAFENNSRLTPLIRTILLDPRTAAPGLSAPRLYYLRTSFIWNTNLAATNLTATTMIDDGAVFYLNGQTVQTPLRMLNTTPAYNTTATSTPPSPQGDGDAFSETVQFPVNLLRPGTNIVAAEVHQSSASSSDIVFGLALSATVLVPNTLPEITGQPADQSVPPGTQVTLRVAGVGIPGPTYQWRFNGTNMAGRTSSILLLNNVQLANAGAYSVILSNVAGVVTSRLATLTVQVSPSIALHPQSQSVFAGTNVILNVTATGALPLFFQWSRDDTPLSGETNNSLMLSNVMPSMSGRYFVTVTNAFGTAISTTAVLTVLGPVISSPTLLYSNGSFALEFRGHPGGSYLIESSSDLVDWAALETVTNPTGLVRFLDDTATNSVRFYRVKWSP